LRGEDGREQEEPPRRAVLPRALGDIERGDTAEARDDDRDRHREMDREDLQGHERPALDPGERRDLVELEVVRVRKGVVKVGPAEQRLARDRGARECTDDRREQPTAGAREDRVERDEADDDDGVARRRSAVLVSAPIAIVRGRLNSSSFSSASQSSVYTVTVSAPTSIPRSVQKTRG
jgi:hypothetical protein